ncbi:MAG: hypothetical protein EP343_19540 [Deltaproteobacteria bacterium]|nr:MAG: hypothetical protein EP343_19540 [Deltaproteobacteria bacterium]
MSLFVELDSWAMTGPSVMAFASICECLERISEPEERSRALAQMQQTLAQWPSTSCQFSSLHREHPAWPLARSLSLRLDQWPWEGESFPADWYDDSHIDGDFDPDLFAELMYDPLEAQRMWYAIAEAMQEQSMRALEWSGLEGMEFPATRWLSSLPLLRELSLSHFHLREPFPELPELHTIRLCDVTWDEPVEDLLVNLGHVRHARWEAESTLGGVVSVAPMTSLESLYVRGIRPLHWELLQELKVLEWRHAPPWEGRWMDEGSLEQLTNLERLIWAGPGLTPHLRGLQKLVGLEQITLSAMTLDSLDFVLSLPNLSYLDLSKANVHNVLVSLPEPIAAYLKEKEFLLSDRDDVELLQTVLRKQIAS